MFVNRGNPRGFPRGGGGGGRGMPAAGYNNGYAPMGYEVYPGYDYSMDYYDYGYAGYPDYGVQVRSTHWRMPQNSDSFQSSRKKGSVLIFLSRVDTADTDTRCPTPANLAVVAGAAADAVARRRKMSVNLGPFDS